VDLDAGELYFVREIDPDSKSITKFVKIGLVRQKENRTSLDRLDEHQTGNPRELHLPADNFFFAPAISALEAQMHRLFAQHRVSGEWFEFPDEAAVEMAKAKAKELAVEIESLTDVFTLAGELAKVKDNGKEINATETASDLQREIAVATSKKKLLDELNAAVELKMAQAYKAGADVSAVASVSTRTIKGAFDEDAFKSDHPELYASFIKTTETIKQSFLVKPMKSAELNLEDQFLVEIAKWQDVIGLADSNTLKILNRPKLQILAELAVVNWTIDVDKAKLKALIGDNQSITGVCTWKRTQSIATVFDKSRFAKEQPKLLADYSTESITKEHVRARKKVIK
jgi:hypothetical protein